MGGVVLGWFMWRTEGRLKAIEHAIDRMARANLMLIIALHQANDTAKAEARAIVREIDDAKAKSGAQ